MVRHPRGLIEAAAAYICVRVTDMAGVNLSVYRFDYDLTIAALLMNGDGTIYHTYGGRTWEDAQSHLSMAAFVKILRDTLADHEAYQKDPHPPKKQQPVTVEQLPWMARKIHEGKKPDCFHCHHVHDAEQERLVAEKRWRLESTFVWPDPLQAGLSLDRDNQARITRVKTGSAAERVGLTAGDRLVRLGDQRVRTFGDVQRVLHEQSPASGKLTVEWLREGESHQGQLTFGKDWKRPTPLVFSWRAIKLRMSPRPGFGGPQLKPDELEALGLPRDRFAFRIQYLVTWGDHAAGGHNAWSAGLRKGDVVLSMAGMSDFQTVQHMHAWFRLTRKVGTKIPIEILRAGKKHTLELPVIP